MKETRAIFQGGLLAIALTMTLGSVLAPSAEAYTCKRNPTDACWVVDGEHEWYFEGYYLIDEELE